MSNIHTKTADAKKVMLQITVESALHLPNVHERTVSHPLPPNTYVTYEWPDSNESMQTSVILRSTCPAWNHCRLVPLVVDDVHLKRLKEGSLKFQVWHRSDARIALVGLQEQDSKGLLDGSKESKVGYSNRNGQRAKRLSKTAATDERQQVRGKYQQQRQHPGELDSESMSREAREEQEEQMEQEDIIRLREREGENLIGTASVELSALVSGMKEIYGWYHVTDFKQQPQGQLKIRITPTELLPVVSSRMNQLSNSSFVPSTSATSYMSRVTPSYGDDYTYLPVATGSSYPSYTSSLPQTVQPSSPLFSPFRSPASSVEIHRGRLREAMKGLESFALMNRDSVESRSLFSSSSLTSSALPKPVDSVLFEMERQVQDMNSQLNSVPDSNLVSHHLQNMKALDDMNIQLNAKLRNLEYESRPDYWPDNRPALSGARNFWDTQAKRMQGPADMSNIFRGSVEGTGLSHVDPGFESRVADVFSGAVRSSGQVNRPFELPLQPLSPVADRFQREVEQREYELTARDQFITERIRYESDQRFAHPPPAEEEVLRHPSVRFADASVDRIASGLSQMQARRSTDLRIISESPPGSPSGLRLSPLRFDSDLNHPTSPLAHASTANLTGADRFWSQAQADIRASNESRSSVEDWRRVSRESRRSDHSESSGGGGGPPLGGVDLNRFETPLSFSLSYDNDRTPLTTPDAIRHFDDFPLPESPVNRKSMDKTTGSIQTGSQSTRAGSNSPPKPKSSDRYEPLRPPVSPPSSNKNRTLNPASASSVTADSKPGSTMDRFKNEQRPGSSAARQASKVASNVTVAPVGPPPTVPKSKDAEMARIARIMSVGKKGQSTTTNMRVSSDYSSEDDF
eukprot:GILK01011859.1.p1 GENE.GILK01011859.1~~GILK01011859.1.p1  ORF type:complete len:943 (-),score=227.10 GILK01011859.1:201-2774(-)